jgi:very-short-patch-repair endonuclease
MENTETRFQNYYTRAQLKNESYKKLPAGARFNLIRKAYEFYMPWMLKGRVNPYFLEWNWTPIEFDVWCDIRRIGLPFYPQVPVLNYFLDFGDPRTKIAIECDGKQWHTNKEKDRIRDEKISALGWQIFRVPGYMCHKTADQFLVENDEKAGINLSRSWDDENQQFICPEPSSDWLFEKWALRSSEGLTLKLKEEYYWPHRTEPDYESPFTAEYFNSAHE